MVSRAKLAVLGAVLAACSGTPVEPGPERVSPVVDDPVPVDDPAPASVPSSDPARFDPERLARMLFTRELESSQAEAMLREITQIAPGRAVGTNAHDRAIRWAELRLRNSGAQDVHREPVVVMQWQRGIQESASVSVGGQEHSLRILALGGSVGTPSGGIQADVARFESIEALRADLDRAQQKIVFFDAPMNRGLVDPREAYAAVAPLLTDGVVEAARAGALAVLLRSPTFAEDAYPRAAWGDYGNPSWIPAATVAPVDADHLSELLAAGRPVRASVTIHSRREESPILSSNVIGEIRGLERPEEILLLTARLDGFDFGEQAHFDGAAVVHCIEALRLLLTSGVRPACTVRVVLFVDGEEPGRGLRSYARDHADELPLHRAVLYSHSGAYMPRGFRCSVDQTRAARAEELVSALAVVRVGEFARAEPAPRVAALGTLPIFHLDNDPHRLFDVRHSRLDIFASVEPRYLCLGAATIASLAAALAEQPL